MTTWVEEIGKRGRKEKHFYNLDNPLQHRVEFSANDLHYREGTAWQEINESIVDDSSVPGFIAKADQQRHIVRFGNAGERRWYPRREVTTEYIESGKPEYWSGTHWRPWNLTGLTRGTNIFTWETTDYKVTIANTWRQIKLDYVLKTSSAYPHIRFPLSLTGLAWEDGKLIGADGQIVGWIHIPTSVDANETELPTTGTYANGYYEIDCNIAGAVYPLAIDPTFQDGNVDPGGITYTDTAKDTILNSANTFNNYGIINQWGSANVRNMLIQFDLSSIPASATCNSATFTGYQNASGTAQAFTVYWYAILSGNSGWIEGTKNNAAAGAGESCWGAKESNGSGGVQVAWAGSAGLSTAGTDYNSTELGTMSGNRSDPTGTAWSSTWDTAQVEAWFGNNDSNFGILGKTALALGAMATSDNTTAGYRPKLVVVYTEGNASSSDTNPAYLNGFSPFLDDFNRDNGDLGSNWWIYFSRNELVVESNQCHAAGTSNDKVAIWQAQSFGTTQKVSLKVVDLTGGDTEFDLLLKKQTADASPISPCIEICYQPAQSILGVWYFDTQWRSVSPTLSDFTLAANDIFSAIAYSNGRVQVFKNGSLVLEVTVPDLEDVGGYVGVWFIPAVATAAVSAFDDFSAESLSFVTNNKSAYLQGSISEISNCFAYLEGVQAEQSTQSSTHGYTRGQLTSQAQQVAYLSGIGQLLAPDGDIARQGSWLNELNGNDLYPSLREADPDDTNYAYLSGTPQEGDYFEVSLSSPSPGTPANRDVIVRWRGRDRNGAGTCQITVELRQGATVLASMQQILSQEATTYTFSFTSSLVTDWTDLRVRIRSESL